MSKTDREMADFIAKQYTPDQIKLAFETVRLNEMKKTRMRKK